MTGISLRNDLNWIVGGLAAAVLLPGLVLVASLPFWVAAIAAGLAFAGFVVLLAPRQMFDGMDVSSVARGRLEVVRKVLEDANRSLDRLEEAAKDIKSAAMRSTTAHLAKTARTIIAGVEKEPERLSSVQRFLTYYLPSAGDLTASYAVMEKQNSPDPARVKRTEAVIAKLDDAFEHYSDSLLESDLSNLDVELRLIEGAVKDDLEAKA
jgi:5-bromo-4-chloroindolyl phosphate hydrolysis protein